MWSRVVPEGPVVNGPPPCGRQTVTDSIVSSLSIKENGSLTAKISVFRRWLHR